MSTVIQRRFRYIRGGLITGCIFLFPARRAYNQGDLKATIFLLHSKLPASFPVSLRKRLFKTMRNSLMTTSKALCMKQKWMNLGIWLCTNWPRDTPSLLMRSICVIWQQSSKIKNFSVPVLREICLFFGIDIAGITMYRKQPYVSKIESLCLSCTCHQ